MNEVSFLYESCDAYSLIALEYNHGLFIKECLVFRLVNMDIMAFDLFVCYFNILTFSFVHESSHQLISSHTIKYKLSLSLSLSYKNSF